MQLCSNYFIFKEFVNKDLIKLKESFKEKNLQVFQIKHFYEGCSEGKKIYARDPMKKKKFYKGPSKEKKILQSTTPGKKISRAKI